jgi:hypothetical protein
MKHTKTQYAVEYLNLKKYGRIQWSYPSLFFTP